MECPDTWFVPRGLNGECECGYSFDGVVSCDEGTKESQSVRLLTSNKTVVGECLFNCLNVSKSYYNYMYHPVPRDLVGGDNNSVCVDTCITRGHSVDNVCTTTTVLPTLTLSTA